MPSPFTIIQGKEGQQPKKPLFLVTITAPDGDVTYLTTAAYYGAPNIVYNSNTYLARIQSNDIAAIQATSPQGYDSLPGFTMKLADGDAFLWANHCVPHGWRGSTVTLTVILWDVVANQYSTDALVWSFIGGNPSFSQAGGVLSMEATSSTNFTRLKVPSIPLEYRCPWDFPSTYAQRVSALTDPTSLYYQCGYSADVTGGCGNLQGGGAGAFTTCDYTRSSPSDPSVGCMARTGNASATGYGPDGDLTHDIAGHYTARFGGVTWLAPTQFSGRQYTSGSKIFGFNQPNTALAGSYYNWVYGTQWVQCQVLAPAGDPNSLRSECVVCVSAFGPATVQQLLVNGVIVPYNNSDVLFTWRYINQGGRSGALNGDAIYNNQGDPHGSVCCIEFVVPAQLASPGSVPSVQALVTSGPLLNCYAITSITGGVATFTGPNFSCAGNSPFTVTVVGNSNPALNGVWPLSSWSYGPPGTATLTGTTASGTGGAAFFYQKPDLYDTGGSLSVNASNNVNIAGPAANLAFAYLDLMVWGNVSLAQIDPVSWYNAAQLCAKPLTYVAADGSTQTHAQFKASFALPGNQRQTLAQVMTALRNSGNLMVAPNSITGLIQCFVRQTLADQQPAIIPGSNDTTARSSVHADGTAGNGFYAYVFNETNIEPDSFKITTTRIEATPNTVSFPFQDENNGYQQDSITEVDPVAYAYSGNQEVAVPVPFNAVPNFDQGSRVANVQLAEACFGNPRNDPGGTLYFEFTTNQRALHLASRLGYICGLVWQERGIGSYAAPQAIRLISVKPDTDGEHWQIKAMWHTDAWYTIAYGQNPAPFQTNPLNSPPSRPPYPWRPGVATWGSGDAMFPGQNSFEVDVDTSSYPAQLTISGALAVNVAPTGKPPLVPLQASTANTGGTIPPGTYHITFSTNANKGPVSSFITVVVPTGTSTNTITVSGIRWQSGTAPAIQPYIGRSVFGMRTCASASYTGSSPDSNGNATSFTFTSMSADGLGLPDVNAVEYLVEEIGIVHGGVWGDGVASVDGTGKLLTVSDGAWSVNQWQNYVLSLYYRPGVTVQPALNMVVSSNTANTLTMPATGFLAGDVIAMRCKSGSITSNTIGDANLINSDSPTGLDVNAEIGNRIFILSGTGARQAPKTIVSNTSTVFTIQGTWDIMPDATSVFIVLEPTVAYSYTTHSVTSDGTVALSTVATTPAITADVQQLLVSVSPADANGNTGPWQYQCMREVYIPPQTMLSSALVLTAPGTLAIASDVAPLFYPLNQINPAAVIARLKQVPTGADLTVQLYSGSTLWMALDIAAGTNSIQATSTQLSTAGPLPAGQDVKLNITGVGTTYPGSDLSVMIFT